MTEHSSTGEHCDGSCRPHVLVLFGGRSGEHSISCITALGVLDAIDRDRYDVMPVGITEQGRWVPIDDLDVLRTTDSLPSVPTSEAEVLPPAAGSKTFRVLEGDRVRDLGVIDVVFPLLHGPYGEDGTLQGMLELLDLPYVGSGVLASAVSMDKQYMKTAFAAAALPVGPYVVATDAQWMRDPAAVEDAVASLGYPVFVKPVRAGSSLGVSRVSEPEALRDAIEAAREHDPKVIVEKEIVGREIECGVLGSQGGGRPRAALPGEIIVRDDQHAFYDFEMKYLDTSAVTLECPATVPESTLTEIQQLAVRAFEAVEAEGLARVDFFVTPRGSVLVNEINTMPGFTPYSMFPMMWQRSGIEYPALVNELIQLALHRRVGLR